MPVKTQDPIYVCDICEEKFDIKELNVDDCRQMRIRSVSMEVYYCGTYQANFVCKKCSNSIVGNIYSLAPQNNVKISEWLKK